ncbi:MAG: DUF4838 domain-containing protein [Lentisphaeria bacterium]|nr:DUF4838 domain-containing protein [Lentisphaeria bacterium]
MSNVYCKIGSWILFLCWMAAASAAVPEYLVTGTSPSRLEIMAENELCGFYRQIYGRELQKIDEKEIDGKSVIFLGRTAFAEKHGIGPETFGQEEWLLRSVDDDLIICGGRPAGTLYGVYALLEALGTAFLAPDETALPEGKPDFPRFDERKAPAFVGRAIYDGIPNVLTRKGKIAQAASPEAAEAYRKWILRRRSNGRTHSIIQPYYVGRIYNLCHWPEWHTLSLYVSPKLFDTHPEYFAMDAQGKRVRPRSFTMRGDVCMSNPDVRKTALESLRKMIRKNRAEKPEDEWSVVYDVTRLDDTPAFCQCPECRKIAAYDGSDTGLLVDFSNYLAREIRKEYPDIIIRIQGHETHGRKRPNKIIPEKNILFRLCDTFSSRDPFRPIETAAVPEVLDYFDKWTAFGTPHVKMLWDYWNLGGSYFNPPRVETVFDAIRPDFKYFLRHGINALFIEAGFDHVSPQNFMMLNYFAASRLMVNPEEDPEKLADVFIRHYYGAEAAPVVRKYFDLIREGVRKDPQKPTSASVGQWRYATPRFLLDLYRDFTEAAAKAKEPRHAARIRYELITPIWSILINWHGCEKIFTESGITKKQLIDECRNYAHAHIRRFESEHPEKGDAAFEAKFRKAIFVPLRPEKFKGIPDKDFRMAVFSDFFAPKSLNSAIVDDPDSIQGKALKSANRAPAAHGIDKVMPGKYKFRTTGFYMSSGGKRRGLVLKEVPQDEKYHWFHIPGKITLDVKSNFWGHGWGINARTNHWYLLTYGDPADNTWDEIWFSAKFTGPAYVPGSKKENAIWVDMVVLTRSGKKE